MTASVEIAVRRLPHAHDLDLPAYATPGSAGMDLVAAVEDTVRLDAGDRLLIPTGISIALPDGHEAQVRPRSGLALKQGLTVLNSPGTVDADYRGEIGVVLINHGREPVVIERGQRIAQLVIAAFAKAAWREVEALPESVRGAGGYGSTGS